MNTRQILTIVAASVLSGAVALAGYVYFVKPERAYVSIEDQQKLFRPVHQTATDTGSPAPLVPANFRYAAGKVRPAVVHIKCKSGSAPAAGQQAPQGMDPFFRHFFGDPDQFGQGFGESKPRESSGSGVIIAQDGLIVTNNHVIDNAEVIEVVLDDKRKFEAKLLGKDPETDLALLKIESTGLPYVVYGDAETVQVGDWVLACGNPFDLTSTVTAGIVSAKGRNINLLRTKENFAIESFIQTDAAVNPGNSGGALVNMKGELIGINTAIATPTGTFAGYSFAVPVSIVKKVMDDLLNYGEVQRALLGIMIRDVTADLAKEKNLKEIKGVYVDQVNENSAAQDAGIKSGDVIISVNEHPVNSASELQESVAQYRPGVKVSVKLIREGKPMTLPVTLKNKKGTYAVVKQASTQVMEDLGAELSEVSDKDKTRLKISGGVKVVSLKDGKMKDSGVKPGFVITRIDKTDVKAVKDVTNLLKNKTGGILIEGVYPDGTKGYYAFGW